MQRKIDFILMLSFASYLVFGNFARFLEVPGFENTINCFEALFLLMAMCAFFISPSRYLRRGWLLMLCLGFLFLYTSIVGFSIYSVDIVGFLYALRLVSLILAGFVAGVAAADFFKGDHKFFFDSFIFVSIVIAVVGLIVLYFFPDSTIFWRLLSEYGIKFSGDPHQGRLMGVFFDPNYYGIMVAFPFLLAISVYINTNKMQYLLVSFLLFFTIFLSGSRSGIATAIFPIFGTFLYAIVILLVQYKVKKTLFKLAFFGMVISGVSILLQYDRVEELYKRTVGMSDAASTSNRISSVYIGLELIGQRPLTGHGYNFAHRILQETKGNTSLDSSPQMILLAFGLPIGSLIILWICRMIYFYRKLSLSRKAKSDAFLRAISASYVSYFVVCLMFSSNFNNVLFYSYWIAVISAVGAYIVSAVHRENNVALVVDEDGCAKA